MSDKSLQQILEAADELASMTNHALVTMCRLGHSFPDLKDALTTYEKQRKANAPNQA